MLNQHKKKYTNKTKKNKSKSRQMNKSKSMHKRMKGGDLQGFPPSYFGNGLKGYFPSGSSQLNSVGKQLAVSQGTIWGNGTMAGPNLFPMKGGNCGCKKQRKSKTNKSYKNKKLNSKKNNKKTRKH